MIEKKIIKIINCHQYDKIPNMSFVFMHCDKFYLISKKSFCIFELNKDEIKNWFRPKLRNSYYIKETCCNINFFKFFESNEWIYVWKIKYIIEGTYSNYENTIYWNICDKLKITENDFLKLYIKHYNHEVEYNKSIDYYIRNTDFDQNELPQQDFYDTPF